MAFHKKKEHAVSEIGRVILLIAVTVILAAVTAAFVFSMVGGLQKGNVAVATTINRVNVSYVSVTFFRGQNAGSVVGINWTVNSAAPVTYINGVSVTPGMQDLPSNGGILNVGSVALLAASSPGNDRVVGVAAYSDGSQQVILDTTI